MALGVIYTRKDGPKAAEKWYRRANKLDSRQGLIDLGWAYQWNNDIPKAMEIYNEHVNLFPNELDGYIGKLAVYQDIGLGDSVSSILNKVSQMQPDFQKGSYRGGFFYYLSINDHGTAEDIIKKEFSDDSLNMNYRVGQIYMFKRDWSNMLKSFANSSYDGMDKGLADWKLGQKDSALRVFNKHLAIIESKDTASYSSSNYHDMARIYAVMGQKEKALNLLQKAFEKGWHSYPWIHNSPFFDVLKDDPDFQALLEKFDRKNEEITKMVLERDIYR